MDKYEGVFSRYGGHSPTCFDNHIEVEDREDWYLMPVSRTRDSECLENSNFIAFLKEMGGESETVEVHRFGHWGPGWYEIIIVDPADEKAMDRAYELARALENYPVLDDDDYASREMEDIDESWDNYGDSDCRKAMISTLESEITDDGDTVPDDPKQRWCKNWGMAIDLCGCGDCILMENERLYDAILVLEDLDSGKLRELARECGMTEDYNPGSTPFHYDFGWFQLLAEVEDIPEEKKNGL